MLVCAVVQSILQLSVKLAASNVPVLELVFVRGSVGAILTVVLAWASEVRPIFGLLQNYPLLLTRALFGAVSMSLNYFGAHLISLHENATLYFTTPAFTALAAWLVLREELGCWAVVGIAVSLAGVPLITRPEFLFGGQGTPWTIQRILGVTVSLAAALTFAGRLAWVLAIACRDCFCLCSLGGARGRGFRQYPRVGPH